MKFLKKFIIFYFLLISISFSLFSNSNNQNTELNGIQLCEKVVNFLQENKIPNTQQFLVSNTENVFPYNILIENNFTEIDRLEESDRLIFVFNLNEILDHSQLLLDIEEVLKNQSFNSTILLLYEDDFGSSDFYNINSCNIFINSLNANDNNILYTIDFSNKNNIISGSTGYTSPAWMIEQTITAFKNNNIDYRSPLLNISQLSKFRFDSNKKLSTFLQNELIAISLVFNKSTISDDIVFNTIDFLINDFENSKNKECDYHSLMINFGKINFWLSEYQIIIILVFIVFLILGFLFILGYINFQQKNESWIELKHCWYILPLTFIIGIAAAYLGKSLFLLFNSNHIENVSTYGIIIFQILTTLILLTLFYFAEIIWHKNNFDERAIDLLILLITFINQFIFCFVDISLFPIFLLISIIAIISITFKSNIGHIFILLAFVSTIFPYATALIQNSNPSALKHYLVNDKFLPLIITLIITPVYMLWFRILKGIKNKGISIKVISIVIGSSLFATSLFLILTNSLFFRNFRSSENMPKFVESDEKSQLYSIKTSDKYIFGELIRTIIFESTEEPYYVNITIEGEKAVPVLYSDSEYSFISNKAAYVNIPLYPGKKIIFTYGSNGDIEKINSTVLYKQEEANVFTKASKTISTEVKK